MIDTVDMQLFVTAKHLFISMKIIMGGEGREKEEIWFGRYKEKGLGPRCLRIFLSIYFIYNIYMDASLCDYSYGNSM